MVAVLNDMQFDLDGYVFGNGLPVFVDEEGFDPGSAEDYLQDGVNPITGARMFGTDRRGAKTWTMSCHVDREDTATALESLAAMGSKWLDDKWLEPATVAMLRYHLAGRTRVVFGKPRRFAYAVTNRLLTGTLPPVVTFDLADHRHYSDEEFFVDLGISPTTPGGFTVPFEVPLVVELPATTPRTGAFTVAGDTRTAPVVEFTGPLTDGKVTIGPGIVVGFTGTLPAGKKITVDTRPWSMGVTGNGGSRVVLSRDTRLARTLLTPGGYEAVLSGTDNTGTAKARVRWRNAYTTL